MGHSTLLTDYLGVNTLSARPVTLDVPTGCLGIFFATDTGFLYGWNGTVWQSIPTALSPIPDGTVLSNLTGSDTNEPSGNSVSSILDYTISSTQGSIIYRGASGWLALGPGTAGDVLQTGGAGANPSWVVAGVTSIGGLSGAITLSADFVASGGTISLTGIEHTANKGAVNGYAGLDSGGRVPLAQLPVALSEAIYFAGTWDANSNSPTLASGTGSAGAMYKVTTAGTTTLDGISQWNIGDQAVFSGVTNTWNKIDGTATEVLSVGGQTGAIGVTGNISCPGGTLTLSGMAAESVPAVGIIVSDGTHVQHGTLGTNLSISGNTLQTSGMAAQSIPAPGIVVSDGTIVTQGTLGTNLVMSGNTLVTSGMAAESVPAAGLVLSNGTHISAASLNPNYLVLSSGTLSVYNPGTTNGLAILDANGKLPFAQMQTELHNIPVTFQVFDILGPNALVGLLKVTQKTIIPQNLTGLTFVAFGTGDLPGSTLNIVLQTGDTGSWTNLGTISVTTGGTISCSGMSSDFTLDPAGTACLAALGPASPSTAKNYAITLPLLRAAG